MQNHGFQIKKISKYFCLKWLSSDFVNMVDAHFGVCLCVNVCVRACAGLPGGAAGAAKFRGGGGLQAELPGILARGLLRPPSAGALPEGQCHLPRSSRKKLPQTEPNAQREIVTSNHTHTGSESNH